MKKKAKVIEKLQNEYYNDMKLYVTAMIKYYLEKKAQSALDEAQYRAYKSFTKTYGKQGELFEQVYQKTLDKKDPSYVKPPRVKKAKAPSKKNTKENEQCDDDNTENVTQDDISDKEDANNSDEDVFQDI